MLISELSFCSGLNIGSCLIIFAFFLFFLVAKAMLEDWVLMLTL
jgi:hypothetical protein